MAAMVVSWVLQPGFFHRKPEAAKTMTPTPEGVIFNDRRGARQSVAGRRAGRARRRQAKPAIRASSMGSPSL